MEHCHLWERPRILRSREIEPTTRTDAAKKRGQPLDHSNSPYVRLSHERRRAFCQISALFLRILAVFGQIFTLL